MTVVHKKGEGEGFEMHMHTGKRPGEEWSYAAANQGTTKPERKAWNRPFLTTSERARPYLLPP